MEFRERPIAGVYEVVGEPYADDRGYQTKPYEAEAFAAHGLGATWLQVIHNHSRRANTLRGLYVQRKPFTEGKLVACTAGIFFWVVVDLRRESPTFGRWDGMRLEATDGRALLVAPGLAHGCLSLCDDASLLLLADNRHAPGHGIGIAWDDPDIGIEWPLLDGAPIISEAHSKAMSFEAFRETEGGI
jgi:dTDP-4-dehydrorhamnose 3,5-epimerase